MKTQSRLCRIFAIVVICLMPLRATAQDWPSKLNHILVPYLPGTSPDILARLLASELTKATGKTFIVENKPGANSTIGTNSVVRASADGSVLLLTDRMAVVVNPFIYKSIPYDWRRDLSPVSEIGDVRMYLMVTGSFPAKNYKDFIAYARANPGKLAFGSGGVGHISSLDLHAIESAAGISLLEVPFKGIADVIPALMSDTVQATIAGIAAIKPFVADNKIKLLAIGSPTRSALEPDVPTIQEVGGTDDMLRPTGYSLLAPAKTSPAVVQKINQAISAILSKPDVVESMGQLGLSVQGSTPKALGDRMDEDTKIVAKLVKELNIQPQ